MTTGAGRRRSCPETLAREAGERVPDDLTKAQACELIDGHVVGAGRPDRRVNRSGVPFRRRPS